MPSDCLTAWPLSGGKSMANPSSAQSSSASTRSRKQSTAQAQVSKSVVETSKSAPKPASSASQDDSGSNRGSRSAAITIVRYNGSSSAGVSPISTISISQVICPYSVAYKTAIVESINAFVWGASIV